VIGAGGCFLIPGPQSLIPTYAALRFDPGPPRGG